MDTDIAQYACADEDYIDMELTSSPSKPLCCSSPQSREFEFQMFTTSTHKETTADELFYKGKLLPLHRTSTAAAAADEHHHHHHHSLPSLTCSTAPFTNTLLHSCNISPSQSCRVSCELNPNDTFFEWSKELSCPFIEIRHQTKLSWQKKLKQKLKSFFTRSADEPSGADHNYLKIGKKMEAMIKNMDRDGTDEHGHRRSFSGAINHRSPTKCSSSSSSNCSSSSSSFSFSSNGAVRELNFLRSSSETEVEVSIDAAIAHCKKSMTREKV